MKKYFALLLLLPTALMIISGAANAQRKNTINHDVKPTCACVGQPDCQCSSQLKRPNPKSHNEKARKNHDHHADKSAHKSKKGSKDSQADKKDKMKHWLTERNEEIDHQYNKVIKKINEAELSQADTAVLSKIAVNNRDLAKRQLEETSRQLKSSQAECQKLNVKYKLCKKINKILIDND